MAPTSSLPLFEASPLARALAPLLLAMAIERAERARAALAVATREAEEATGDLARALDLYEEANQPATPREDMTNGTPEEQDRTRPRLADESPA